MKYLFFIIIIGLVGFSGYYLGTTMSEKKELNLTQSNPDEKEDEKEDRETRHNRDDEDDKEEEEIDSILQMIDSLGGDFIYDTLTATILPRDSVVDDEELNIKRERMLASKRVPVKFLQSNDDKDSTANDINKTTKAKDIILQIWESPLGFTGYKFANKTLIVYGFAPQLKYSIYAKNGQYFLSVDETYYKINESHDFVPFKEVSKSSVFND
jgi:hypothetical protein